MSRPGRASKAHQQRGRRHAPHDKPLARAWDPEGAYRKRQPIQRGPNDWAYKRRVPGSADYRPLKRVYHRVQLCCICCISEIGKPERVTEPAAGLADWCASNGWWELAAIPGLAPADYEAIAIMGALAANHILNYPGHLIDVWDDLPSLGFAYGPQTALAWLGRSWQERHEQPWRRPWPGWAAGYAECTPWHRPRPLRMPGWQMPDRLPSPVIELPDGRVIAHYGITHPFRPAPL